MRDAIDKPLERCLGEVVSDESAQESHGILTLDVAGIAGTGEIGVP
jgi:hypothetical protein